MTNPGSPEAKRLGCTCPTLDNRFGEGAVVEGKIDPNQFYTDPDCPIHRDRRLLNDSERRGEGNGGGVSGSEDAPRYDSSASDVPASSAQPAGEDGTVTELPADTQSGSDSPRLGDSEA